MLCWGNAGSGQQGLEGAESDVLQPQCCQAFLGRIVKEVACGFDHSVFLLNDGGVYTCGSNVLGQLGHNKEGNKPCLVEALNAQKIAEISCGQAHCLALNEKGQVFSWGSGRYGQLGLGTEEEVVRVPRLIKKLCEHRITQAACGSQHCIALSKDGQLFTWGQNTNGQLGLGKGESNKISPQPLRSLAGVPLAQISAGGGHSFAVSLSGAVFGWGRNGAGQLGLNDKQDRAFPCHIKSLRNQKVVYISCGEDHTAALTKDGGLFTFGAGSHGQLGHDSTSDEILPRRVIELMGSEVSQVACGRNHTLAFVPSTGLIYAFGCNTHGQLGNGCISNSKGPQAVKGFWVPHRSQRQSGTCLYLICLTVSRKRLVMFPLPLSLLFSNDEHFRTNPKNPGIDLSSVRLLFEMLAKPTFCKLFEQTTKSFESLLIPQLPSSPPDVEAMRIYLILCECPVLHDSKYYITLTIPLAMAILRLDTNPSKVLDNWWALGDSEFFSRLIEMYKCTVVFLLGSGKSLLIPTFLDAYVTAALKLLEKLHKVCVVCFTFPLCYSVFFSFIPFKLFSFLFNYFLFQHSHSVTLCSYPFIFNAKAKTKILQTDAELQMQIAINRATLHNVFMLLTLEPLLARNPFLVLHVRRSNLVSDALRELSIYSDVDLKKPLKVIFDGEEAVDAGGVTKEFFLLLLKELLDPIYGMFSHYEESNLLWFSDKCFVEHNWFHLTGIMCGLAIYNSTVVDLHFPLALYKKLLDVPPTLEDLKELSPTEGRSLQQLLEYPGDDIEDAFCLNFSITRENYGVTEVKDLVPGGQNITVNKSNRQEFVDAYLNYVFNRSVQQLYRAFSEGFLKVCGGKVLSLFQPSELMAMVVGNSNYNWEQMEKNAVYKGEYSAAHPTVQMFWQVFHEFPLEKKRQFLLFLTGSDRIPIYGMESLQIAIQSTAGSEQHLPVAHTCYNLLDMPRYTSKEVLRKRLTQAIEQYEGFSLV
uniref:HECT and RLD domain containing E3 ubiquitin protein ligase 3 n=1 Tax=Erpetoichthys calabaricus TaxID=27687 RepID=A0A8C4RM49_ERPCA